MRTNNYAPRLSKDALVARMNAIEAARVRMRSGHRGAAAEIRRIARLMTGFVEECGSEQLGDLAAALEISEGGDFEALLNRLLGELEQLISICDTQPANILLVEDDPIASHVLASHLEAPTRRIFVARSMAEAEAVLGQEAVSLVLLDLFLPDSDGRNFLVDLRQRPELDGVPVIVSSTDSTTATKAECYNLGADEFFEKPISPEVLSAAVTSKLQRAREIFLQSKTDKLTGLGNRGALSDAFQRLEFLVDRTDSPLSLAILDVDRFKRVNDIYGHATGDQVLKVLAQFLTRQLRDGDVVSRWGGEEFVALFPNTDDFSAARALSNILGAFRQHRFESPEGQAFAVSFSAGVVEMRVGERLERALTRADTLMYAAKEAGRNRIFTASTALDPRPPRLLLVARDPLLGTSVQYRLAREGFDTQLQTTAAAALEAASGFDADLLLLERKLPDMSGPALLSQLRQLPAYHKIPVLMLAEPEHEAEMAQGFGPGVSDFLLLPLSEAELVARIRRLIKRLRLPDAATV